MPFLTKNISWDKHNPSSHSSSYCNIAKQIRHISNPYIGNKKKLISFFNHILIKNNLKFNSFFDVFSGSAVVGLFIKKTGTKVLANDILKSSHQYAIALIENDGIALSDDEISFLMSNKPDNNECFVQNNWSISCPSPMRCRFTEKEAHELDCLRSNIRNLDCREKQALAFSSVFLVCMRLPFGFVDKSIDIHKHREKQKNLYGKKSKNHDRRIGIYYDDNLELNFQEWVPKYIRQFQSHVQVFNKNNSSIHTIGDFCDKNNKKSLAVCEDVIHLLETEQINVDCAYFDPPYGGTGSDYGSAYHFFEEYVETRTRNLSFEDSEKLSRFVNKNKYQNSFNKLLELSSHIPLWIFSYNDSSWNGLDYIISIIKNFKSNVIVESKPYRYNYRDKKKLRIESEHFIIAF